MKTDTGKNKEIVFNIDGEGTLKGLYTEVLDYEEFGIKSISITRASNVEPMADASGRWFVEILSTGETFTKDERTGKEFFKRSEALAFEVWLLQGRM